jgi:glycosyltransferase involved in cell wall biosynthesis
MRILFVSEQFPYPLHDGGNLRTHHILHGLAREHDVTLLSHEPMDQNGVAALRGVCHVVTISRTRKLARLGANLVQVGTASPLFLLRNRSKELLTRAVGLLVDKPFDVVHFNHLDTACFALERAWSENIVFDSHNCLSDLAGRAGGTSQGLMRGALLNRESKLLRRTESAVCAAADLTLTCSDLERTSFQRLWPPGHYATIPNGVATDYFCPGRQSDEEPGVLVFSGAMSYWPNEQAALYICREILPLLLAWGRKVKLYLVGKRPGPRVQALHDGETVIVTGAVDDVRPYIRRAQVVVVPLRHGAGTRLKILEAFAMRKAVVSTSLGAEGIPAADGHELLLADDATSFARQITRLLDQPSLRAALGDAALSLARNHFDWRIIQQRLLKEYDALTAKNRRLVSA